MMRILVVTDAWTPQINGVVRTLQSMSAAAIAQGADIVFVTPQEFSTVPLPSYPDIRLALAGKNALRRKIAESGAAHIHIATEGPLGWAARGACLADDRPFTTSYHTRFPEYLHARARVPLSLTYSLLRRFHRKAIGVMVATQSVERDLSARKFPRLMRWTRGVDHQLFRPQQSVLDLPRPIFLNVGRLAVEKNIEAFLKLDLPGSKVLVGDGPARATLQASFPDVHFLGSRQGKELAAIYASADVFVFPSRTDTFGLVMLEALSCGVPVAAMPVPGPLDVIGESGAGVLHQDLRVAALAALSINRGHARSHAERYSWDRCAEQFLRNISSARSNPIIRPSFRREAGRRVH